MKKIFKILLSVLLFLLSINGFSRIEVSSITNNKDSVNNSLSDTVQILEDQLAHIKDTCDNCISEMLTLNLLAQAYTTNSPLKALDYAFEAVDIAYRIHNNYEVYDVYSTIGQIYHEQGLYDEAIEYFEKTLLKFNNAKDFKTYPWSYVNIGNVLYAKNDFEKSKIYYLDALKYFKQIDDTYGRATVFDNIGLLYRMQAKQDSSLIYFNKSLNIRKKLGNKSNIAFSYKYLAETYMLEKKFNDSYKYYAVSLKLYDESNDVNGKAKILSSLGDLFAAKKQPDKALEYYLKSAELYQECEDNFGLTDIYNRICIIYESEGNNQKAIKYSMLAYQIGNTYGILLAQQNSLAILNKLYSKIGNYKEAYKYQELYYQIKDSIKSENASKMLLQLEMKFSNNEHMRQLEIIKKENQIQELIIKKRTNLIYYFLITLVILLVLVLSNFRKFVYKIKLAKQFSFDASILSKLGLILIFSVYLSGALYIIKPFGVYDVSVKNSLIIYGGLGLITACVLLVFFVIFNLIEKYFNNGKYDIYKYIAFIVLIIMGISCCGWKLIANYKTNELITIEFYNFIIIIVSLILFPVFLVVLFIEKIHINKQNKIAKIISHHLSYIEKPEKDELFEIKSEKSKEEIKLLLSQFICAEAQGNYTKIYYLQKGNLKDNMMLITLKSIEEQLKGYEAIIRCHKSYIVNKLKIKNVTGNSQGYKIHFKEIQMVIPVSRSFSKANIKDIKKPD